MCVCDVGLAGATGFGRHGAGKAQTITGVSDNDHQREGSSGVQARPACGRTQLGRAARLDLALVLLRRENTTGNKRLLRSV